MVSNATMNHLVSKICLVLPFARGGKVACNINYDYNEEVYLVQRFLIPIIVLEISIMFCSRTEKVILAYTYVIFYRNCFILF
jgi:hypothetical protein